MEATATLPNHPGDLIRVALGDLALVEADPRYRVNMNGWHSPRSDGLCHVCLAGAVMAGSLSADAKVWITPGNFTKHKDKLHALDHFRIGAVRTGLLEMGLPPRNVYVDVTPYNYNPAAFRRDMLAMADALDAAFPKDGSKP